MPKPSLMIFRSLATLALMAGLIYLLYRWQYSIDGVSPIIAWPLLAAETLSFIGIIVLFFNLWFDEDPAIETPPYLVSSISGDEHASFYRALSVDVFFTTLDEPISMLRASVQAALKMTYPSPISIRIFILDDGRRPEMQDLAHELGVDYIARTDNKGFKAGNIKNAFDQTQGDIVVIFDADSIPRPTFLMNTLGYFRDPDVAWVQTPQWFADIPDGYALGSGLSGAPASPSPSFLARLFAPLLRTRLLRDPLFNDASVFYQVIQRKRNFFRGSFCCGAASLHRRTAVTETALRGFSLQYRHLLKRKAAAFRRSTQERTIDDTAMDLLKGQAYQEALFAPYAFHISEDIHTSLILHGDPDRRWQSVLHPIVECHMTSPQDVKAWSIQRFKYCAGSLDILLKTKLLLQRSLNIPRKLYYFNTLTSYLFSVLNAIFFMYPLLYLFFGLAPVNAYSQPLVALLCLYIVLLELACVSNGWGHNMARAREGHFVSFPLHLKALTHVLLGRPLKFTVTPKERSGGFSWRIVRGQTVCAVLGGAGVAVGLWHLGQANADRNALLLNLVWATFNTALFGRFLIATFLLDRRPPDASPAEAVGAEDGFSPAAQPTPGKGHTPVLAHFSPPALPRIGLWQGLREAHSSAVFLIILSLLPLIAYGVIG